MMTAAQGIWRDDWNSGFVCAPVGWRRQGLTDRIMASRRGSTSFGAVRCLGPTLQILT